jgi:hypothetical protein
MAGVLSGNDGVKGSGGASAHLGFEAPAFRFEKPQHASQAFHFVPLQLQLRGQDVADRIGMLGG